MISKEPKKVTLIVSSTKEASESETAEMARLRLENELLQEKMKSLCDPWAYRRAGLQALKENRVLEALGWFEKALVSDSTVISEDEIKKLPDSLDTTDGLKSRVITDVDKIPEIQKKYSEFNIDVVIQGAVCIISGEWCMRDEIRELSALSEKGKYLGWGKVSILMVCAFLGYEKLLRHLVDCGADVNQIGGNSITMLMAAGVGGYFGILKYLVEEKKMEIHQLDSSKRNVLFYAAYGGNLLMVKYLIDEKKMDISQQDSLNETILFAAARSGSLSMVKYLVDEKGMDIRQRNMYEKTLLFDAVSSGSLSMVKHLVEERGMDTSQRSKRDETVLFAAVWSYSIPMMKYLVEERGIDIQLKNVWKRTILFEAIESRVLKMVKYLVEQKGMNVHILDQFGNNLLCDCEDPSIIRYLLNQGLRLTTRQRSSMTKFKLALIEKEEKVYGDKVGEQPYRGYNDTDEKSEGENNEVPTVISVELEDIEELVKLFNFK